MAAKDITIEIDICKQITKNKIIVEASYRGKVFETFGFFKSNKGLIKYLKQILEGIDKQEVDIHIWRKR